MNLSNSIFNPQGIWVPRVGTLEGEVPRIKGGVEGEYTIKKYKAGTDQLVQEIGPFRNLITDFGLNLVGTSTWGLSVFVGSGTTPPSVSDTTMGAWKGTAGAGSWYPAVLRGGPPDYWVQGTNTTRFPAGSATGNLTEVGVGVGSTLTDHRVFSRALILDTSGNPVTLTVLPDEYLDVTYSLRYYPYLGPDVVTEINISGVTYTTVTRAYSVTSCRTGGAMAGFASQPALYGGVSAALPPTLGPVDGNGLENAGAWSLLNPGHVPPYVNNSRTLHAEWTAGLDQGNTPFGIRGLHIATESSGLSFIQALFQTTITPAIPKNNTNILRLGASYSWDRKV